MPPRIISVALFALLLLPASARAGTYDVYSCRLPDGSAAATDGWAPVVQATPELGSAPVTHDGCQAGGALTASFASSFVGLGDSTSWRFTAPADTTIVSLEIRRSVTLPTA